MGLLLALVTGSASAAVIDTQVNPANGHTYHLLDADTWTGSDAEAIALGGHLVTVNDGAENEWVLQVFGASASTFLWIGLNDFAQEGSWVWVSGEPVTFTNWGVPNNAPPEPNSITAGEDAAAMVTELFNAIPAGGWLDTTDTGLPPGSPKPVTAQGVVEVPTDLCLDLTWDGATDGDWGDASRWGPNHDQTPGDCNNVTVAPSQTLTVQGPSNDTTVKSLVVGGGPGQANLRLSAGAIASPGGVEIAANGVLSGSGSIDSTITTDGTIDTDDLTVTGGLTMTGTATTRVELRLPGDGSAPTAGTDFDRITVTGDVTLGGTLDVDVLGANDPEYGQSFTVMTWAARTGTFTTFDDAPLGDHKTLVPLLNAHDLTLTAAIPGDANLNGEVTIGDLSLLAANFGTNPGLGSWMKGDFNGDGLVTVGDLSLLAANWGSSTTGEPVGLSLEDALASVGLPVPEPATPAVLIPVLLTCRRRRPVRAVEGWVVT